MTTEATATTEQGTLLQNVFLIALLYVAMYSGTLMEALWVQYEWSGSSRIVIGLITWIVLFKAGEKGLS